MAKVKADLLALKQWQLKHWAFLIGMPSAGTKTDLANVLAHGMSPRPGRQTGERISSVDLGIRNFAYCTVEAPPLNNTLPSARSTVRPLRVVDWKRLDLTDRQVTATTSQTQILNDVLAEQDQPLDLSSDGMPESAMFTLPRMSRLACNLTRNLAAGRPDKILIERQFLPRGPAARATSEWTLRIAKLESMLWAGLESLREERSPDSKPFPSIHAVNPDRIATFWASGRHLSLRPTEDLLQAGKTIESRLQAIKRGDRKLVKADKVAIVRSWVAGNPDVPIRFEGSAARIAEAFQATRKKDAEAIANGKIDDLADCLLQAVAWLRWEENRRAMDGLWRRQWLLQA